MRNNVKIGILGGFLLIVIMFIYWMVNQQPKSNQPVNLTGKTSSAAPDPAKPAPPPSITPAGSPSASPSGSPSSGSPAVSPPAPSDGGHVYMAATPPAPTPPPTPSSPDAPPLPSVPQPLDTAGVGSSTDHGGASAPTAVLAAATPGTTAAFAALRSTPDGMHYYQTKPGDSAWSLAMKFYGNGGAAFIKLLADNNLTIDVVHDLPSGVEIEVPTPPASLLAAAPAPHADSATTRPGEYIIKDRDTLNKIAKDKLGSANLWQKIVDANPGLDPEPPEAWHDHQAAGQAGGGPGHRTGRPAPDGPRPWPKRVSHQERRQPHQHRQDAVG